MTDLDNTNYSMIRNIPYLNYDNTVTYKQDAIDLSANLPGEGLQKKIRNLNNTIGEYLKQRNEIIETDDYATDRNLIDLFNSNNNLARDNLYNKTRLLNNLHNRTLNLKNNFNFNNVMLQTLENDASGGEIDLVNKNIEIIDRDINEKKKQLEINTYYEKKFSHQINILKNAVIIFLFILLVSFIYKQGFISEKVFLVLVALGIFIAIMYVIYSMFDIYRRDNQNYDHYKSPMHSSYYLNKGGSIDKNNLDLPLHLQNDLIPEECLSKI